MTVIVAFNKWQLWARNILYQESVYFSCTSVSLNIVSNWSNIDRQKNWDPPTDNYKKGHYPKVMWRSVFKFKQLRKEWILWIPIHCLSVLWKPVSWIYTSICKIILFFCIILSNCFTSTVIAMGLTHQIIILLSYPHILKIVPENSCIYTGKLATSLKVRACSHEPVTVNYPGLMIAPG